MTRKLVTVRQVSAVEPIPGADLIECITIEGWKLVSGRGNFKPGDLAIYFEIDSFLPQGNPLWDDLVARKSRVYNGQIGHVLRTIKLRGVASQGFAIPINNIPVISDQLIASITEHGWEEGAKDSAIAKIRELDFAELLGVTKYEKPIPASLIGVARGSFPQFIRKTDQERVQNVPEILEDLDAEYEVTTKLDGSSMTVFFRASTGPGVCSRNLELVCTDENAGNTFVRTATETGLIAVLTELNRDIAVQGELMGPGVQGNRENLKEHEFYVYDIFDITTQQYLAPAERRELFEILSTKTNKMKHVPVQHEAFTIRDLPSKSIDSFLLAAEGPSINHNVREGNVYKRTDGQASFKVVSNSFLLKSKD